MANGRNGKMPRGLRMMVCENCSFPCYAYRERGEYNYRPNSRPDRDIEDKPAMLHSICRYYDVVGKMRLETIEQKI